MPPQRSKNAACLQCRSQKLKCERNKVGDSELSPCLRCARADRICRPSPSSRLGRPPQTTGQWTMVWECTNNEIYEPIYPSLLGLDSWNGDMAWDLESVSPESQNTCTTTMTSFSTPVQQIPKRPFDAAELLATGILSESVGNFEEQDPNFFPTLDPYFNFGTICSKRLGDKATQERDKTQSEGLDPKLMSAISGSQSTLQNVNIQPDMTAGENIAPNDNIQALSALLSRLCKGLENIQNEQVAAIDWTLGCLEEFAYILDRVTTPILSRENEDIIQAIYGTSPSMQESGQSPAVDMPVILLVLSCYIKMLSMFCVVFTDFLKIPSPTSLSLPRRSPPGSETCSIGLPCWHFGLQNKGIRGAILLQLVQ
ncbi:hypothetical protein F5Y19DRAFT_445776 [Xylariaceae sp. FL1651]|nr:hypothetical protein F5Y19DRAFT_445776 [Xylariaceae sp. FL1651]